MSYQDVLQLMFPFFPLRASNKRWGTLTDFGKFHPPQKNHPSVFIYLITKLSNNLTEPNDD